MKKKPLSLSEVYALLEPGPVVLVTTAHKEHPNIMTMSWHTMMEFEPPIVGCVISENNYSFNLLKTTKECVINIPTVDLAEKVVGCGNTSGQNVDKFKTFQLTAVASSWVKAPLIDECFANLECKVIDMNMVTKYNFFILEVLNAWLDMSRKNPQTLHHQGRGQFMVAGKSIKLPSNMR
ncbi:flavin reductase family protein [Legionella drancourtii]|uniref:Flavin reductase-like protein, FMN-binding n=1 Tax=Legionella drancourtii LLAP12 TaxID=658187 RepID=G9EQK4_9GAMM|nr:flavin reductase family protein [Legionella drancourtii]EHL30450.1 flavin reductase-like protein, FMN-binding [Legionella drancourtii LLAP12]